MMGRNHLIAGACSLEHAYVANELMGRTGFSPVISLQHMMLSYFGIEQLVSGSSAPLYVTVLSVPLYLAAYFFGTLLPDIDNPKSMLGRFLKLPFAHRTWLHAIYFYLAFAVLGLAQPVFSWIFFGVVVHLFWDSFSAMGNCWFYKLLSDYRKYPNGAKVKIGHKLKLYYAGQLSEYIVLFIIIAVSVASFVWIRGIGI